MGKEKETLHTETVLSLWYTAEKIRVQEVKGYMKFRDWIIKENSFVTLYVLSIDLSAERGCEKPKTA